MVTTEVTIGQSQPALDTGVDDLLGKPFARDMLGERLRNLDVLGS
jgi:DNA-binding response OmpR family regulator